MMLASSTRLLSRGASRRWPLARELSTIKQVGVVGLGLMGHGVVQVTAMASSPEYMVVAVDGSKDCMDAGKKRIDQSLSKMLDRKVKKGVLTEGDAAAQKEGISSRISYASDVSALADCDLVVEAITENPEIKFSLFKDLARVTRSDCILASNTSSLSIKEMAVASGRPSHVVGLHFFNPVQLMKLVEVVRCDVTDPAVFEECKSWAQTVGKHPVSCVDTPGFIVNRLLVPGLAQGMLMYDRGDGSVEDIDKSMELGAGHPMGPLTLADYVGLDICLSILDGWVQKYPDEPSFVVPECLREKVAAGKLGRKSGEGFYLWDGDKRTTVAP
ncbi:unnamed protein product [Ectocarpus sp. 4 AP-2014]